MTEPDPDKVEAHRYGVVDCRTCPLYKTHPGYKLAGDVVATMTNPTPAWFDTEEERTLLCRAKAINDGKRRRRKAKSQ